MKATEGEGRKRPTGTATSGFRTVKEHKGAFTVMAIILALIVVGVLYSQT